MSQCLLYSVFPCICQSSDLPQCDISNLANSSFIGKQTFLRVLWLARNDLFEQIERAGCSCQERPWPDISASPWCISCMSSCRSCSAAPCRTSSCGPSLVHTISQCNQNSHAAFSALRIIAHRPVSFREMILGLQRCNAKLCRRKS